MLEARAASGEAGELDRPCEGRWGEPAVCFVLWRTYKFSRDPLHQNPPTHPRQIPPQHAAVRQMKDASPRMIQQVCTLELPRPVAVCP